MAVLCSFRQYPNLSLLLTRDGLMDWMLGFFRSGAHDLYFLQREGWGSHSWILFIWFAVNTWFASIFLYLFWFLFYVDGVYFRYCWTEMWDNSKLLFFIFGIHSAVFWTEDTGSTYHLKRFICVSAVMRVCLYTQEWRFACSGVCVRVCATFIVSLCVVLYDIFVCKYVFETLDLKQQTRDFILRQLYPASYGTQNHHC